GLPLVAGRSLAGRPHVHAVDERTLWIPRAHPALGEFRDVIRHQGETGAAPRGKCRAALALCACEALEPTEKIVQEVRRLLQPLRAQLETGMYVEPEGRL